MKYAKGQTVKITKIGGLHNRIATITDIVKLPNKRTLYTLKVEGFAYPYHCISSYINEA